MDGTVQPAASPGGGANRVRPAARSYRLGLLAVLGVALAAAGGASRYDEDQQALVRLAALLVLAASLWPLEGVWLRNRWRWFAAVAALYAVLLLQLIPLPPALWGGLPGHDLYAQVVDVAGAAGWRPLSLTPDLTRNALLALLPPTAAGLGALYLDRRGRRRVAQGIVGLAVASALLGLVQLTGDGTSFHLYRETSADAPVGLFANRNHQAVLLASALPLIGALAGIRLREGGDVRLVAAAVPALTALLLLALVSTGSRMGLALGVVGLAGGFWCVRGAGARIIRGRHARVSRIAIGLTALAMIGGVALAALHSGAIERLTATDTVGETRVAMLAPLRNTALAFMPFGAGFGAFDDVYRRFEPDALLSTIYMNQAHDEPLQLAIEGGLPALALLLLFLGWWLRTGHFILRMRHASKERAMARAALVVTIIAMASSLVDYPLRTPLLASVFVVACVELIRAVSPDRPHPGSGRRGPSVWRAGR